MVKQLQPGKKLYYILLHWYLNQLSTKRPLQKYTCTNQLIQTEIQRTHVCSIATRTEGGQYFWKISIWTCVRSRMPLVDIKIVFFINQTFRQPFKTLLRRMWIWILRMNLHIPKFVVPTSVHRLKNLQKPYRLWIRLCSPACRKGSGRRSLVFFKCFQTHNFTRRCSPHGLKPSILVY